MPTHEAQSPPATKAVAPETIVAAFRRTVQRRGDHTAVRSHDGRLSWTWSELAEQVDALAAGLWSLGVRRGETVALLLRNRPEFFAVDLAVASLGAVPFSLYATSAPAQQQHAISDAGARFVVAEEGLRGALDGVDLPEHRFVLDGDGGDGWRPLDDLRTAGAGVTPTLDRPVGPDDVLTMIYTSGTTGAPKGVPLTHRNMLGTVAATTTVLRLPVGATVVSWLPAAHIGERAGGYYIPMVEGWEIVTVADPREVVAALRTIHPLYFFAPPRIFEKLRASFDTWLGGLPDDERARVEAGLRASLEQVRLEQAGEAVPDDVRTAAAEARSSLVAPWRAETGLDRLRISLVATAPNPGPLMEFFHTIGIPLGEAYGMTESGGAGTAVGPDTIRIGRVGQASLGLEIRIADDGEVLMRGPQIMSGYHNRPEATAETIDADGWLHSGDLGELDADGYLKIIGRKKELIIGASGKNISPVAVEAAMRTACPLIAQICCVGDARPYLVAIVVLDGDAAAEWAAAAGLEATDVATLARDERLRAAVQAGIDAGNATLARPEQIKRFTIVPGEWTPGGDELTPTTKLRRREIFRKYADTIEELYA